MSELGRKMLAGDGAPMDHAQALRWISAAAERDDADALLAMATLAGMGALIPQNWDQALAWLERAAILGSPSAQGQLRLLSGTAAGAGPETAADWARLRAGIDIGAWMSQPSRRPVSETPRVRVSEGFAPKAACDWLRSRAEGRLRRAATYDRASQSEQLDPGRTCREFAFGIADVDLVLVLVRARIALLAGLPVAAMEPPRIFHYGAGEEFKPHFDRYDDQGGYGHSGYAGDRIVTFLIYLNDGYDGGELCFPRTGLRHKGGMGDAVYFANIDPAGKPDPMSLHAGLPVTSGEKWILSQWIHDRPFGMTEPALAAASAS
jgi:hypothetical protein